MNSCTFENNFSADLGGGLFNRGSMVVSDSVFRDNLGRVSLGSLSCFNEYEFFLNDVFFSFFEGRRDRKCSEQDNYIETQYLRA